MNKLRTFILMSIMMALSASCGSYPDENESHLNAGKTPTSTNGGSGTVNDGFGCGLKWAILKDCVKIELKWSCKGLKFGSRQRSSCLSKECSKEISDVRKCEGITAFKVLKKADSKKRYPRNKI